MFSAFVVGEDAILSYQSNEHARTCRDRRPRLSEKNARFHLDAMLPSADSIQRYALMPYTAFAVIPCSLKARFHTARDPSRRHPPTVILERSEESRRGGLLEDDTGGFAPKAQRRDRRPRLSVLRLWRKSAAGGMESHHR